MPKKFLLAALLVAASPETWAASRTSPETWTTLARALGEASAAACAERRESWERELGRAVNGSGLRTAVAAHGHVFVPFSGGDAWGALALNPRATRYTLADRWNATTTGTPHATGTSRAPLSSLRHWNATRLRRVAAAIAHILTPSSGFQWGNEVRQFAAEYGTAPLLLGALGAFQDLRVKGARVLTRQGLPTLVIRCDRDGTFVAVRYVQCDLHDAAQLASLRKFFLSPSSSTLRRRPPPRVATFLKGTELALMPQHLRPEDLRGASDVAVRLAASERLDAAKDAAAEAVLEVSDLIVQDSTGVPFRRLAQWGTVHAFGAYTDFVDSGRRRNADFAAMAAFFRSNRDSTFDLGRLRFGYCAAPSSPAHYAALVDHGPRRTPLRPAFDDPDLPGRRRRDGKESGPYYCHMLLVTRRHDDGPSSSDS